MRERWDFRANGQGREVSLDIMPRLPRLPALTGLARWRRAGAETAFLTVLGLTMAVIGPYGTSQMPLAARTLYWLACIIGGGAIGIGVDEAVGRRLRALWARIAATSVLMTPAVASLVLAVGAAVTPERFRPPISVGFLGQVLVMAALVTTLRALTWRPPRTVVQTQVVVTPPLPEAEAAFRSRLSAKRRGARLIAVQAEDHYVRVHTDKGDELLGLRFTDALAELSRAHGFQTHRSWWLAADAIESVRWRSGVGQARLAGGLTAPVSRIHAPKVKAAGWF